MFLGGSCTLLLLSLIGGMYCPNYISNNSALTVWMAKCIFACLCLVSLWISACRSHAAVRYIRGYRMCSTGISKHGHKHQNSSLHTSSLFVSSSAYTQAVNAFLDNGASINRKYHVSFLFGIIVNWFMVECEKK